MDASRSTKGPASASLCDKVLISLRKIIQSIDLHSRFLVKQCGLTGPQLILLQEIANSGEISVGRVAKACSLSQATVTGVLERLEKRGLVQRRRSDIDRRRVMVQITGAGTGLLEQAPPPMQENFVEEFSRLQDWEQTIILASLQRVVAMMDAKTLKAAPFLATGPIDDAGEKQATAKSKAALGGTGF